MQDLHNVLQNRLWFVERNIPADVQRLYGLNELMDWRAPTAKFLTGYQTLGQCDSNENLATNLLLRYIQIQARHRPVVYQLNLAATQPHGQSCLTANSVENLFATVLLGGAAAVEFIVQPLWDETNSIFVSAGGPVAKEVASLKAKLDANPCFTEGTPLPVRTSSKSPVKIGAWTYQGKMCALAVNTALSPVRSSYSIAGMAMLRVRSLNSSHTISGRRSGPIPVSLGASGVGWYSLTRP